MDHAIIFCDGGARGNPGPGGIGVVLKCRGDVKKYKKFIGRSTNNQAEYQALIFALERARECGAQSVDVFMDSELVVSQMNQKYRVKEKDLARLFVKAWNLTLRFKKVAFRHIARNDNKEADHLVNEAIDFGVNS